MFGRGGPNDREKLYDVRGFPHSYVAAGGEGFDRVFSSSGEKGFVFLWVFSSSEVMIFSLSIISLTRVFSFDLKFLRVYSCYSSF